MIRRSRSDEWTSIRKLITKHHTFELHFYQIVMSLPTTFDSILFKASQIFVILLQLNMVQGENFKTLKVCLIGILQFTLIKRVSIVHAYLLELFLHNYRIRWHNIQLMIPRQGPLPQVVLKYLKLRIPQKSSVCCSLNLNICTSLYGKHFLRPQIRQLSDRAYLANKKPRVNLSSSQLLYTYKTETITN